MRRLFLAVLVFGLASPAFAKRLENPIAVFAGLDKITGVTTAFEAKIGETVTFGGLTVTPRVCYSREITEEPKTTSFVEVVEVALDGAKRKIFSGWMLAESPGLSSVEHPIYDVWLTGCRDPNAPPVPVEQAPEPPKPDGTEDGETND